MISRGEKIWSANRVFLLQKKSKEYSNWNAAQPFSGLNLQKTPL